MTDAPSGSAPSRRHTQQFDRILLAVTAWPWPTRIRRRLLRALGLAIGSATVRSGVVFGGRSVAIGDGTFVNAGCFIDNLAEVRIGSNCALGMQVLVLTSTHPLGGPDRRALNPGTGLPVVIGDGCWVGARAVIMPGVTIAPGCVIGAGAVVTEDTEPDKVYAGVPARVVRELS